MSDRPTDHFEQAIQAPQTVKVMVPVSVFKRIYEWLKNKKFGGGK